jgi:hypothetical protein
VIGVPLTPQVLGLPSIPVVTCPGGPADVLCSVAGAGGSALNGAGAGIAAAGAGAVLGAFTAWVVGGAVWLLDRLGDVLSATTTIDVGAHWFTVHFSLMVGVVGVVVLPMVLLSVLQAIYRQSSAMLLRSLFVHLPLAALLTFAALQLVQMALKITDDLSALVASGTGADLQHELAGTVTALTAASADGGFPAFVLLLGALLVALGAFALWVELLVRAAAVYVTVLFLPLALASLVWPAVSHWCRKLVETLASLILSKFVIVAILSLATGALSSGGAGTGGSAFAPVLAGGALLLLAAFSPFLLLRLVPMAEAGAVHQLEAARHRMQHAATTAPRTALRAASLAQQLGAGTVDEALAGAGPVGSGLGSMVGGVGAVPGDPASAVSLLSSAGDRGSSSGRDGDGLDDERGTDGYAGPLPVMAGVGAQAPDDERGDYSGPGVGPRVQRVVEHDDMGPTLRFVRDRRPSAGGGGGVAEGGREDG